MTTEQTTEQPKTRPSEVRSDALLDCPFCGGKATMRSNSYAGQRGKAVHCNGCEAEVFFHEARGAEEYAMRTWNTRQSNISNNI